MPTLTLIPEPEYLSILQAETLDGVLCCMVTCTDYDHYKRLPEVTSYNGRLLGKTGWNSDTQRAHYQSNALMAKVV
jgi:hypothetical protein